MTTKEIKKKHSSRPVGGVEMGSQGGEDAWQGSDWRIWVGEAVAVRLDKEAAGGVGGPIFACG